MFSCEREGKNHFILARSSELVLWLVEGKGDFDVRNVCDVSKEIGKHSFALTFTVTISDLRATFSELATTVSTFAGFLEMLV